MICHLQSGFPPIPGQEAIKPEQGLAAALETASKLASNEADGGDDDDEEEEEETKKESKQVCLFTIIVKRMDGWMV